MATRKKGLGRGLDALLGSKTAGVTTEAPAATGKATEGDLRELPIDLLQRGQYQPRVDMHTESLDELAESIRSQGVVQPIVVRPVGNDKYEIIAGERRWRAAQLAGLQDIPAVVREVDDRAAIAMALIENIQRENLNPMEEANAIKRLIDEFELTHQQAAEAVGRSRTGVSNLLRLLDLNPEVKQLLEDGTLEMGHARALLALKDQQQTEAARRVASKGLSVRETEQLVRKLQAPKKPKKPAEDKIDPNIRHLQSELSDKLGASVKLQHASNGKGKLVIQYNSLDELDGILEHIH
jgi:ParB family chromosome partitioning protein